MRECQRLVRNSTLHHPGVITQQLPAQSSKGAISLHDKVSPGKGCGPHQFLSLPSEIGFVDTPVVLSLVCARSAVTLSSWICLNDLMLRVLSASMRDEVRAS